MGFACTRFNVDRPADFTGHSLSVSDIVVLHQDGKDTAHYCDRVGFTEVPEFLQERQPELTPDDLETGERIQTPRGSFYVTAMRREQMEAAGYGVHHISDDGKYLIMGNSTRAFTVAAEQPEKDNPLRTAEMTLEDDYGMTDGVINNGRRCEELEKARSTQNRHRRRSLPFVSGWWTRNGSVPSISSRSVRSPTVICRAMTAYEPKQEMAAGMGVLPGGERQATV